MTAPMMTLAELAEKGPDVDVLRQMVQFMAQRLMDVDVDSRCGAGYDEKAPGTRLNSRNGFRERTWEARAGVGGGQPPNRRPSTPLWCGRDGCPPRRDHQHPERTAARSDFSRRPHTCQLCRSSDRARRTDEPPRRRQPRGRDPRRPAVPFAALR
jgi:hypothetical protein